MRCQPGNKSLYRKLLYGGIAFIILAIFFLIPVPPVSRDALTHHLAIPKLYLLHGGIYEIPDLVFSYYPMNLDLLYMILLAFGNDIIPKFIHFSFALLTGWLIYTYIKNRINGCYGLLGALFFLSIPIIIKLSITVYVDLGLIFFSTASLLLLFQWAEKDYPFQTLFFAGICCGLAVGTKYNGLISLLILTCFVPILYIRSKDDTSGTSLPALKYGFFFVAGALLALSPWLIRNFIWTGNPLYPLFDHIFNPIVTASTASETKPVLGIFKVRELVYHETPLQMLLLPIRIFFEGQDNIPKYFDGRLNPFLLILPLLAFIPTKADQKEKLEKIILAAFSILFFLFALFTTVLRIRYISTIIPPLAILAMFGLRNLFCIVNNRFSNDKFSTSFTALIIAAMLLPNFAYLYQQFKVVEPVQYLSGQISRDAYLTKHRPDYATKAYANKHLTTNAMLLCIFMGGRGYYLDRPHIFAEPFSSSPFFKHMQKPPLNKVFTYLQQEKITHLLIRDDLLAKTIMAFENEDKKRRWYFFFKKYTKRLYTSKGYTLYKVEL